MSQVESEVETVGETAGGGGRRLSFCSSGTPLTAGVVGLLWWMKKMGANVELEAAA